MVLKSFPIVVIDKQLFNKVLAEAHAALQLKSQDEFCDFNFVSAIEELTLKVLNGIPQPTHDRLNAIFLEAMCMHSLEQILYFFKRAKFPE